MNKVLTILILFCGIGCSSQQILNKKTVYAATMHRSEVASAGVRTTSENSLQKQSVKTKRQLIYRAEVRMLIDDIANVIRELRLQSKDLGGYLISSNSRKVELAIPAEDLIDFVEGLPVLGKVLSS